MNTLRIVVGWVVGMGLLIAGTVLAVLWLVQATGGNDVRDACRAAGGLYVDRANDCAVRLELP